MVASDCGDMGRYCLEGKREKETLTGQRSSRSRHRHGRKTTIWPKQIRMSEAIDCGDGRQGRMIKIKAAQDAASHQERSKDGVCAPNSGSLRKTE